MRSNGVETSVVGWLLLTALAVGPLASSGSAQGRDAMGQGEALINVRSDVKLGIKGTGGTTSEHLQQLADAVADRMPDIRACYGRLVQQAPTTVGAVAVRMSLAQGDKAPTLELKPKEGSAPELIECVRTLLGAGSFEKVGRPAAAIVSIDFQNSRAEGQAAMAERRSKTDALEVRASAQGGFEAGWTTSGQEVSFLVRGKSSPAVGEVTKQLRERFAGFVDCRRRARKGERSPAGLTKIDVHVQAGGVLAGTVQSTSVDFEDRVVRCVDKVLQALRAPAAPAGQRVSIDVTFAP